MAKSKKIAKAKRAESKALVQKKQRRRKLVTFMRMCRYGVNNFTRNAWLTLAAMAVMTITLLIIFIGVVSHQVLTDTVSSLRDRVSMSMYLDTETSEEDVSRVVEEVLKLESVLEASSKSPSQAREEFIDDNGGSPETLDALKEATNRFPWTVSVKIQDINETEELRQFSDNNEAYKEFADTDRDPSFAGDRRTAIESIGNAAKFAQQGGIIVSSIFIVVSMLIIFNTIRMAIFNRREEIQMMKLIGAERSFIRGPFVVEAVVYGFFAALLATAVGYGVMVAVEPYLISADIAVGPAMRLVTVYTGFVLLAMVSIGAVIGLISSSLATRKYLKEWS